MGNFHLPLDGDRAAAPGRAREAQIQEAFQECERELEGALRKLEDIDQNKKKRRCTLQYFQSAVAGLKSILLDVQISECMFK